MASLNRVFLTGRLTRDPELRYLPSGNAVADLKIAVHRKYTTQTGESRDDICFVAIAARDSQAEQCGEYLKKGAQICVEGALAFEQWVTEGIKNSRLSIRAGKIHFLETNCLAE